MGFSTVSVSVKMRSSSPVCASKKYLCETPSDGLSTTTYTSRSPILLRPTDLIVGDGLNLITPKSPAANFMSLNSEGVSARVMRGLLTQPVAPLTACETVPNCGTWTAIRNLSGPFDVASNGHERPCEASRVPLPPCVRNFDAASWPPTAA